MIKALQAEMGPLQEKLYKILYPNVADDAATVKELIGRFEGRQGLYALQNGPGFTRRTLMPPLHRLAPRVLAFADKYESRRVNRVAGRPRGQAVPLSRRCDGGRKRRQPARCPQPKIAF